MTRRAPEFLARETYRKRRLTDAARFLPVFGVVMVMLPMLRRDPTLDVPPTASETVYLFAVWSVLIIVAYLLSLILGKILASDEKRTPVTPDAEFSDPDPEG